MDDYSEEIMIKIVEGSSSALYNLRVPLCNVGYSIEYYTNGGRRYYSQDGTVLDENKKTLVSADSNNITDINLTNIK